MNPKRVKSIVKFIEKFAQQNHKVSSIDFLT